MTIYVSNVMFNDTGKFHKITILSNASNMVQLVNLLLSGDVIKNVSPPILRSFFPRLVLQGSIAT